MHSGLNHLPSGPLTILRHFSDAKKVEEEVQQAENLETVDTEPVVDSAAVHADAKEDASKFDQIFEDSESLEPAAVATPTEKVTGVLVVLGVV